MRAQTPLLLTLALLAAATPATAQQATQRFAPAEEAAPNLDGQRPLTVAGVAKWLTPAGSVAAAGWGLWAHGRADDRYGELEARCVAEPERCSSRGEGGVFTDPALEAEYQDILELDRQTRWALVGSQVGVLASVALFILDMGQGDDGPTIIPFDPTALRVAPARGGGVEVGVRLAAGR